MRGVRTHMEECFDMMNGVKAVAKKYNEVSLILRIVAGLVIGAAAPNTFPGQKRQMLI